MQTYKTLAQTQNIASIDSLKIRIPLSKVRILDTDLGVEILAVNANTHEIIETDNFKKKSLRHFVKGVTTYYGLESQIGYNGIVTEYLVILFNSKLLHERYFEGITDGNIGLIYDRIIDTGIAYFDYETFLLSECTDVDLKKDIICKQYKKGISIVEQNAKPHKKVNKGCNHFNTQSNVGIEFGKRETATDSYPFVKIYHKGIELGTNKSLPFYMEYLSNLELDLENIVRIEATIKNRKHFKKYGITDTSLGALLKLTQDKMNEIISKSLKVHLEPRTLNHIPNDKLKPSDQFILNQMRLTIALGCSWDSIMNNCIKPISESKSKKRILERVSALYSEHIKGTKPDLNSKELDNFYEAIGWA